MKRPHGYELIEIKSIIMSNTAQSQAESSRKGIRERIMDCLTSRDNGSGSTDLLRDEEKDDQDCIDSYVRELTRTTFSKVWNSYRYKKWGQDPSLPPLEELEKQMLQITPSYCTLYPNII